MLSKIKLFGEVLLPAAYLCMMCLCGGGSDIGNPDISGCVAGIDGKGVGNCEVILGPADGDPGRIDTVSVGGGFRIIVQSMSFDTIKTDKYGNFTFCEIPPGKYSVVASKDNLLGMFKVDHHLYFDSDANIELNYPACIVFDNYSQNMDTMPKAFKAARVSGSIITNNKDVSDKIYLAAVPAGNLDLILYREDKSYEYVQNLRVSPLESLVVYMDPIRKRDSWTYIQKPRDPLGRPYVLASYPADGAVGESALINWGQAFDVEIQFSHPMATRQTGAAITVFSSDSSVKIDTLWWQGSDVIKIDLCDNQNYLECTDDSLYLKKGVRYYVAFDTSAQTALGVNFAWPDTLSFMPVP